MKTSDTKRIYINIVKLTEQINWIWAYVGNTNKMDRLEYTKTIVKLLATRFDMDFEDMLDYLTLKLDLNMDTLHANSQYNCHAYVSNKHGICRCNRGKYGNDMFCKTHREQFDQNNLQFGYYDANREVVKEKNEIKKKLVKAKTFEYNGTKFLYDPHTYSVYDKERKCVGRLVEEEGLDDLKIQFI